MTDYPELGVCATVVTALVCFLLYQSRRAHQALPPSPPSDFLIGHVRRLPLDYQWKTFAHWGKQLGETRHWYAA